MKLTGPVVPAFYSSILFMWPQNGPHWPCNTARTSVLTLASQTTVWRLGGKKDWLPQSFKTSLKCLTCSSHRTTLPRWLKEGWSFFWVLSEPKTHFPLLLKEGWMDTGKQLEVYPSVLQNMPPVFFISQIYCSMETTAVVLKLVRPMIQTPKSSCQALSEPNGLVPSIQACVNDMAFHPVPERGGLWDLKTSSISL